MNCSHSLHGKRLSLKLKVKAVMKAIQMIELENQALEYLLEKPCYFDSA